MTIHSKHILPLTSLRFFAALMIFMVHTSSRLGMPNFKGWFSFGHGVSFFYVLSGFILTYVYFRPGAKLNLRQFFRKRFFRLYPLHIATLIAVVLLIPLGQEGLGKRVSQIPLQLTMTQSWLGTRTVAFGFNGPAWSISTEFGFYILFPFLLKFFDKIYSVFLASIALSVAAVLTANYLDGAFSDWLWQALQIHPLGRLMEFICGMCAAKYFLQKPNLSWSKWTFSGLEILALGLIMVVGSMGQEINSFLEDARNSLEMTAYITRSGLFLFFGFLIWIVAQEKGFVSQWLSNKTLVFLGEISFAFYLIHLIVIRFFEHHYELMMGYHHTITFTVLLVLSLGFSYAAYKFIEVPFQKLGRESFRAVFFRNKWRLINFRAFLISGATLSFGIIISVFKPGYQEPSEEIVAAFKVDSIIANFEVKNVDATLTHYRFQRDEDRVCYEMLWVFGEIVHDTPIKRIVNIPYLERRRTISHQIILPPSAWRNSEGKKIHVLDDFCILLPSDDSNLPGNLPGNLLTRVILQQATETGFEVLNFEHNGASQNLLLLSHSKPEYFLWRQ